MAPSSSPLRRTPAIPAKAIVSTAAVLGFSFALGQTAIRFGGFQPLSLQPGQNPWDLLAETMAHQSNIPCKCLVVRKDTMHLDAPLEMWTEQSADGRLKLTVLSPLSEQGVTSLDDGHQWITYLPDENRVIVEASPRDNHEQSAAQRIRIAKRNYDLIIEHKEPTIAGRRAISLVAVAKHRLMPNRRYCIDAAKDFLLRMEILGDPEKVMLDTKAIDFPGSIPDADFELAPKERALLRTYSAPDTISLNAHSKSVAGFTPAIPNSLPCGFVVDQSQLVHGRKGPFIAVRLTDGLVNATLYEWNAKAPVAPIGEAKYDEDAKGIKLRLVGEVPEAVFTSIIQTFVREALKRTPCLLARPEETLGTDQALNTSEQANQEESAVTPSENTAEVYDVLVIEITE